jgi:3-oxoacyl-[acyl-carrier protein] reductase
MTEPAATYPDLRGKVALVTGGSKGIGAETCRLLAANGVGVMVCARGAEAVEELVAELRAAGGDAHGRVADATVAAQLDAVREQTESELGPIDILVPFAGGFSSYTPIHEISEAEWREVIDANLTSTFLTIKAFLPGMLVRRRGSIVTMASNVARLVDVPLTASYAAAKAGIIQLTRHVAKEVAARGVRVNCVAPATTLSERVDSIMSDELRERITALSPLGRLGTPADSAHATLFLASDVSAWMSGVTIDVAGGRVML